MKLLYFLLINGKFSIYIEKLPNIYKLVLYSLYYKEIVGEEIMRYFFKNTILVLEHSSSIFNIKTNFLFINYYGGRGKISYENKNN